MSLVIIVMYQMFMRERLLLLCLTSSVTALRSVYSHMNLGFILHRSLNFTSIRSKWKFHARRELIDMIFDKRSHEYQADLFERIFAIDFSRILCIII